MLPLWGNVDGVRKTVTQYALLRVEGDIKKQTFENNVCFIFQLKINSYLTKIKNKKIFPLLQANKWILQRFRKKKISFVPKIYVDFRH